MPPTPLYHCVATTLFKITRTLSTTIRRLPHNLLAATTLLLLMPFAQAFTIGAGSSFSVPPGGELDIGCTALRVEGEMSVGGGDVLAGAVTIDADGVLNGDDGILLFSGDWTNNGNFSHGTSTVVITDDCAAGPVHLSGNTTFHNLTLASTGGGTFVIPAGASITVTGTLTIEGQPGQPINLVSSSPGTAAIKLGPGAHTVVSNANIPANVLLGLRPAPIPTLGHHGLILLTLLLAAGAAGRLRQSGLSRRFA
jgi:hypothetical protein